MPKKSDGKKDRPRSPPPSMVTAFSTLLVCSLIVPLAVWIFTSANISPDYSSVVNPSTFDPVEQFQKGVTGVREGEWDERVHHEQDGHGAERLLSSPATNSPQHKVEKLEKRQQQRQRKKQVNAEEDEGPDGRFHILVYVLPVLGHLAGYPWLLVKLVWSLILTILSFTYIITLPVTLPLYYTIKVVVIAPFNLCVSFGYALAPIGVLLAGSGMLGIAVGAGGGGAFSVIKGIVISLYGGEKGKEIDTVTGRRSNGALNKQIPPMNDQKKSDSYISHSQYRTPLSAPQPRHLAPPFLTTSSSAYRLHPPGFVATRQPAEDVVEEETEEDDDPPESFMPIPRVDKSMVGLRVRRSRKFEYD